MILLILAWTFIYLSPSMAYADIINTPIRITFSGDIPVQKSYHSALSNEYLLYPSGRKVYLDSEKKAIRDDYVIDENGDLCYADQDGRLVLQEKTATSTAYEKKGLQGDYILTESGVTGSHMLLNFYLDLADSADPSDLTYELNGHTYYFNPSLYDAFRKRIQEAKQKGIKVTIVLLLRGNAHCAAMEMMSVGKSATDAGKLYALNPKSESVRAFLEMAAMQFSTNGCFVDNWILGNEVNMPNHYNYTGSLDVWSNASLYADTAILLSECVKKYDSASKIYISLDHSWTDNMNGNGIAGKDFLNAFYLKMKEKAPNVQWNIAFHLYAPLLNKTASMWENPDLNSANTLSPFISPVNLSVLTSYVRDRISPDCRIILSEQGFNAREGQELQAKGLAMCFAAAENDPMVDAVIFRSYKDEGTDGDMDLGLISSDGSARTAYQVYQALETSSWPEIRDKYVDFQIFAVDNNEHAEEAAPSQEIVVRPGE